MVAVLAVVGGLLRSLTIGLMVDVRHALGRR